MHTERAERALTVEYVGCGGTLVARRGLERRARKVTRKLHTWREKVDAKNNSQHEVDRVPAPCNLHTTGGGYCIIRSGHWLAGCAGVVVLGRRGLGSGAQGGRLALRAGCSAVQFSRGESRTRRVRGLVPQASEGGVRDLVEVLSVVCLPDLIRGHEKWLASSCSAWHCLRHSRWCQAILTAAP